MREYEIPFHEKLEFKPKKTRYCVCIPTINEGDRIKKQLSEMERKNITRKFDVLLLDGKSSDGSLEPSYLKELGIRGLFTLKEKGRLSAQLRLGYAYALNEGYQGVITVDGNNKDNIEAINDFSKELDDGYDFVQGSRYLKGGRALNTPFGRTLAIKFIHIPIISFLAGFKYTDTTNGFRAYSIKFLTDFRIQPFRKIFDSYELLAYLSVKSPRCGFKTKEIPVIRTYPEFGPIVTKISFIKGHLSILKILLFLALHKYDPPI
ncbi:MAG: glycosyl transferase family 2 [Elusimicrobia bacterium RIFCSPLOWO2_02_FULL_39_32]|nr:MAG: glycosyl transferase family 2 [Elusimicrobia bacterium GWA2_38_7]OGR79572.1 MAG: glycosyl transferase family 2 [Elusimicrobia bacterium RIFCSPHIGHO2_02_FULL_39_36]OGR92898.1 MAG: glycosyl transferase family 2 [Elusimicrobia bacterium RIFCSPLOWO2_02_FULL_39_32]OGR99682.1 MAG: glycosyl transferase family 2 [Elusimicrobia bacterium RIFCSPLOWO2_12_FULL_39_28]